MVRCCLIWETSLVIGRSSTGSGCCSHVTSLMLPTVASAVTVVFIHTVTSIGQKVHCILSLNAVLCVSLDNLNRG